jgi:hypothetical protein
MKNKQWLQSLALTPLLLGAAVIQGQEAIASPAESSGNNSQLAQSLPPRPTLNRRDQVKTFNANEDLTTMNQVTSVSELSDVQPTEWAFEALRSLVERYGCIVGYPDRTFRGNRALTRWEFAAGLNACMNTLERLIQENVAVLQEDLDKLKRLVQEFQTELAALGARVDNLEQRVAFLEDHQFSTTTKLRGEVIFSVQQPFGDDKALNWRQQDLFDQGRLQQTDVDEVTTFGFRTRLSLDTSFTGNDLLRTRLQAGNIPNLTDPTGTNMARLAYDTGDQTNVIVDKSWYRFKTGDLTAWIGPRGLALDDIFDTGNPFLTSSANGALNRYNRYNPLVYRGPEGAGIGAKYQIGKAFSITGLYLANDANDPSSGRGLFNGAFSAGAQLGFTPSKELSFAATYLHSYFTEGSVNLTGGTGSAIANNPFLGAATTRDSYALQANWRVTPSVNLSAWGAYALASAESFASNGNIQPGFGADLWTWNAAISFIDLGKEGAVLSFSGGLLPRAARVDAFTGELIAQDQDSSYLIETQYRFPINKNINITPGFYVILDPNSNSNNSAIWVGVLRTTFVF